MEEITSLKEDQHWCVYIHTNRINNKAYIGMTQQKPYRRWQNGYGYKHNPYFYNSIEKYGWDNFQHIIFADNLSKDDAAHIEKLLIALYDTTNKKYGYNISTGDDYSRLGIKHSETTKQILRNKAKERLSVPEKNPMYGISPRERMDEKTYQTWLINLKTNAPRGESHPMYGKKGIYSAIFCPVYCIELDEIFWGSANVYQKYGIAASNISNCCMGNIKSAGKHPSTGEKLHWIYVYDKTKKNGIIIDGALTKGYITLKQLDDYFKSLN